MPHPEPQRSHHPIILFDGYCHLCNGAVDFLLARDRRRVLRFASLQSGLGQRLVRRCQLGEPPPDSIVLVVERRCYVRSEAVLRACRYLPAPWKWCAVLRMVPRPIRDGLYDWIARQRYQWFGRREQCRVPGPEDMDRFLE
ncbi:MAG: DCC1-like thiol-disulfide oxidoreductase family protein [candidate division KSB1 bacterium]|nr:DCC1-like thiol-disulfide oxidoreductase family protein [candidate division KSB1 bacterium]MDQ7063570.1 DCC1-like thiol-disulfide oxidoreductase family protein [candidate division KSB1 bacterium]